MSTVSTQTAGKAISQSLLPEFDMEMGKTRKALERIPADKFAWKPHAKSFSMGDLAVHIATMVGWGAPTLSTESLDINPPGGEPWTPPKASTSAELLAIFDKGVAETRAAVENATDAQFMAPWTLLNGGQAMFTMPRVAVIRGMIFNHLIHHRGQLTVYLRLNDVPVPSLYGPSADEAA